MLTILLLAIITFCYAGYNLFIKISASHVPESATTTVLATFVMQSMTLVPTLALFSVLKLQGGHVFKLDPSAFLWAAIAGVSIGAAEVAYYYLFSGIGQARVIEANVAVPIIVGGTVGVVVLASALLLKEAFGWPQMVGTALIMGGVFMTFLFPK